MNPAPAAPGSAAAAVGGQRLRVTPVTAVIIAATLLALALRVYQLSRPGFLLSVTEYDDGPYFGSAIRLVNGAIPYRDFLIVQPPGITILMLPAALLSKLTGTAAAMAVARILTTLAGTASVTLVGVLVRHRGAAAAVLACGITAVFPDAIAAAHTVLVEPWLVLFCLLGAVAVFEGDQLTASRRRLAWGGAAFGFAGAIEVWAIFAVIGLILLLLRTPRRAAILAAGMTAGFAIPVLPFAALSPGGLYDDIVLAQVRVGATPVPLTAAVGLSRLREMTGLTDLHPAQPVQILTAILILTMIFGSLIAASVITRREPADLDWFTLAAFAITSAAFLWPPQFYYHFTAFLAPFLAMAIALPATRLLHAARPAATSPDQLTRRAAVLAGTLIMTMSIIQASHEAHPPEAVLPGHHRRAQADTARRLPGHRPSLVQHRRRPVHLQPARLPAADRPHRNQLRHVTRPRPAHRRGQIPETRQTLAQRTQPRAIRLALQLRQPQNPLDPDPEHLLPPQHHPHTRHPRRRTLPARQHAPRHDPAARRRPGACPELAQCAPV